MADEPRMDMLDAVNRMGPNTVDYNRDPAPEGMSKLIEFIHTLKPFRKRIVEGADGRRREAVVAGDVDEMALTDFWGFTNHINSLSFTTRHDVELKNLNFKIAAMAYRWSKPRTQYTPEVNAKMEQLENLCRSISEMSVDGFGHVMGVTQRVEQSSKNEFKTTNQPKSGWGKANDLVAGGGR